MAKSSKSLILFITPSQKEVNGGVMSIFSLAKESRKLFDIHKASVEICVYIGHRSYEKNDLFDNEEHVYSFEEIMLKYPNINNILIHTPEIALDKLYTGLAAYSEYISRIPVVHINIMNQNILHMRKSADQIFQLYKYASRITQTTAHERYSTQEFADKFCLSLKHLSVFIDPSQYRRVEYKLKKKLIAYSPDKHILKDDILDKISKSLPGYELIEIKNMPYAEYKSILEKAKFTISFGEGLDGYIIESTFSGGIGIASYNEDFFPSGDFLKNKFIYKGYDEMYDSIVNDILDADKSESFQEINDGMFMQLSEIYSYKQYQDKLRSFYKGHVDYIPQLDNLQAYVHSNVKSILSNYESLTAEHSSQTKTLELTTQEKERIDRINSQLQSKLTSLENSTSWRITKPLRVLKRWISRR